METMRLDPVVPNVGRVLGTPGQRGRTVAALGLAEVPQSRDPNSKNRRPDPPKIKSESP